MSREEDIKQIKKNGFKSFKPNRHSYQDEDGQHWMQCKFCCEYQKVDDTLDDETKDVFYDNVKGKLTDLWLELARHIDQDMESVQYGEYDDDENDQKEIIQQLKKDNDKLSNDAKEFIDNPKNYLKKLINSFDSKDESIKVINGKKYKAIKESKEHIFKKTYKKIGGK